MDKSQQYTLRRFTHLTSLFPTSTSVRRPSVFGRFDQPVSSDNFPKQKHNPSVTKPVYIMEKDGRTYFSKSYTRFGILGTKVVFGQSNDPFTDDVAFLVHDFSQGNEPLVVENAQPLTWWGIRGLIILNNLRSLVSPVFAVLGFLGRVIGTRGFEDLIVLYALGYLFNYFLGLNEVLTWIFGILFGLNLFVNLCNKLKWLRAIAFFQYYILRRARRFEETVDRPYNFYFSLSKVPLQTPNKVYSFPYQPSSSMDSQLNVFALVEQLFHTVDRHSYPYKATKEDYVKALLDFKAGYTYLGLSDWSSVSRVFEQAIQSRDSELFVDFLHYLGITQDDENYHTYLANLRRIAGYKKTDD